MSTPTASSDPGPLEAPAAAGGAPAVGKARLDGLAKWFCEEVKPHDSSLKAYLRSAYPAVRDVEDIVQESYLRVWRRQLARPIASARSFLFAVARHLALDTLRHERRAPYTLAAEGATMEVADDAAGTREAACTREEVDFLVSAIERLPARTREIFLLRKFEGLSQAEISGQLGISLSTIETHIWRANRHCERFLRLQGVIRKP